MRLVLACAVLVLYACDNDSSAVPPNCGDAALDPDEECDDGNTASGDGCSNACTFEPGPNCGDGIVQLADNEECDDGNTADGDGCSSACKFEAGPNCGDGTVQASENEECDDGNTASGDGCDAQCRIEPPMNCGNNMLDIADGEECDDGNTVGGDGCSASCQFEMVGQSCGNGTMETGEKCDDGNTANGDACNSTCNFTNATSLFVGALNMPGTTDGAGGSARIGGYGVLTVDQTHLYFGDATVRMVRKIEIATATVTTIAGGGPLGLPVDNANGLMARFVSTEAIATDGTTIWIADAGRRIRAVSTVAPYAVTTVAGCAPGATDANCMAGGPYTPGNGTTTARFQDVRGLTYYNGKVYFVDSGAYVLGSFDPATGDVVTLAGTPNVMQCPAMGPPIDGVGAAARFCAPRYMASDNGGTLFIADTNGGVIRTFSTATSFVGTLTGDGTRFYRDGIGTAAGLHRPRGMTSDGTSLYWVENNAHTIRQAHVATTAVTTMIGTPLPCAATDSCAAGAPGGYMEGVGAAAKMDFAFSVAFHFPSRSMFFVDSDNNLIRRIQ